MGYTRVFKNDTITLSKVVGKEEYWLYDTTRGMNLSMRAKTEQAAFIEALMYYQKRLSKVEGELVDVVKSNEDLYAWANHYYGATRVSVYEDYMLLIEENRDITQIDFEFKSL